MSNVAKVRKRHQPWTRQVDGKTYCQGCTNYDQSSSAQWPCDAVKMLVLAEDGWKRVARAERKMNALLERFSFGLDEYDESEVSSITEALADPDVQALLNQNIEAVEGE